MAGNQSKQSERISGNGFTARDSMAGQDIEETGSLQALEMEKI